MSEIAILVESTARAGWMILCALGLVALGLVLFDRRPAKSSKAEEAGRSRRAA